MKTWTETPSGTDPYHLRNVQHDNLAPVPVCTVGSNICFTNRHSHVDPSSNSTVQARCLGACIFMFSFAKGGVCVCMDCLSNNGQGLTIQCSSNNQSNHLFRGADKSDSDLDSQSAISYCVRCSGKVSVPVWRSISQQVQILTAKVNLFP